MKESNKPRLMMNSHSNTPVLHLAPCINSFIKVKYFQLWTFYMRAVDTAWLRVANMAPLLMRPIQCCRKEQTHSRHAANTVPPRTADARPICNSRHAANTALPRTADARPIQRCHEQSTRGQHSMCKSQCGAELVQRGTPPR